MSEQSPPSPGSTPEEARVLEIRKLAHDLNNALMPIQLGLDAIRRKVSDPSLERTLNNMERGAQRAAELADQILKTARGA